MLGVEADYEAFSFDGFGLEEEGGFRITVNVRSIVRLLLLHRRVVIHENECAFVFGVGFTCCTSISGTKIATRIIFWERNLRRSFLLSLPRSLRPMRRHHHPRVPQGIEPPMRDIIQYVSGVCHRFFPQPKLDN